MRTSSYIDFNSLCFFRPRVWSVDESIALAWCHNYLDKKYYDLELIAEKHVSKYNCLFNSRPLCDSIGCWDSAKVFNHSGSHVCAIRLSGREGQVELVACKQTDFELPNEKVFLSHLRCVRPTCASRGCCEKVVQDRPRERFGCPSHVCG